MINIIVAVAQGGVIGGENRLLWHISEDLQHFKAITSGHPVVMGRKTFESLGRPLPNRENVVITRREIEIEGCRVAHSLEEALAPYTPQDRVFIIGGAQIYREALPLADRLYITRVDHQYEGDTLFPEWDEAEWQRASSEHFERGAKYEYPFTFEEYRHVAAEGSELHISQATRDDAELIHTIARASFYDTYRDIVSPEQNEWMFQDMYSVESLQQRQFDAGQLFFIAYLRGEAVGYVSLEKMEEGLVHLHKLYVKSASHGGGIGAKLITFAFRCAKEMCGGGACRLELDVNRRNRAVGFYHKMGLSIAYEVDNIIEGTTFCRPDYIMAIEL